MSKNIRIIYLYVVSLITLAISVVGLVGIVNNLTSYFAPSVYAYNYYYAKPEIMPGGYSYDGEEMMCEDDCEEMVPITGDYDALKEYKKNFAQEKKRVKNNSLRDMFSSMALFVVSTPLYIFHYSKTKKEEEK